MGWKSGRHEGVWWHHLGERQRLLEIHCSQNSLWRWQVIWYKIQNLTILCRCWIPPLWDSLVIGHTLWEPLVIRPLLWKLLVFWHIHVENLWNNVLWTFFFLLFKKKLLPFPHRLDELAEGICPQILSKTSAPVCFPAEKNKWNQEN